MNRNVTLLFARRRNPCGGFSLIEVLFAIGMLGIGIVAILSLFTTGIASAAYSQNLTTAAMEAQSLFTRVISEVPAVQPAAPAPPALPLLTRTFLCAMAIAADNGTGAANTNWIQNADLPLPGIAGAPNNADSTPALIDANRDLYWNCRASKFPMNPDFLLDSTKDNMNSPYPKGLYQIAIAVYRNVKPGTWPNPQTSNPREPIVVFTTLVSAY